MGEKISNILKKLLNFSGDYSEIYTSYEQVYEDLNTVFSEMELGSIQEKLEHHLTDETNLVRTWQKNLIQEKSKH